MTLVLRYAARSDRGLVRANNEDSVYAGARLLALADGMGGHAAGEVASQLVIAALAHLDDDEPGGDLLSKLDEAVRDGNSAIAAHVEVEPELEGMGTTLTAILFAGNRLGLVHIGDSRGYLLRDGELTQITKDDTFVQTLVDEGRITAEEAHSHPQRSLIMRALTGHEVEPTLIMREAREGDRYLLCSDGLSDPVSHETILEALQIPDVAESADRLIELALRGGGPGQRDRGGRRRRRPRLRRPDPADPGRRGLRRRRPRRTAQHRRGPGVGDQPAAQRRQTGGARTRTATQAALTQAAVHRRRAGACCWCWPGWRWAARSSAANYYVSAYNGTVAIMRGIQGSILGYPLQEPYLLGCLNDRNELSQISYGQAGRQPRLPADAPAGSAAVRAHPGLGRAAGRKSRQRDQPAARAVPQLAAAAVPATRSAGPADARRRTVTGSESVPAPSPPPSPRSSAPAPTSAPRTTPAAVPRALAVDQRKSKRCNGFPAARAAEPIADGDPATPAATEAGRRLPGGGMTTQPQAPVVGRAVDPDPPQRRTGAAVLRDR